MTKVHISTRMRVVIVGDDPIERAYLQALHHGAPDVDVVSAVAADPQAVVRPLLAGCDLMILAVSSRPFGELELVRESQQQVPGLRIMAIVSVPAPDLVLRLLELGVVGMLLRPVEAAAFLSAIAAIRTEGAFLCPRIALVAASFFASRGEVLRSLSRREAEVLEELATGQGVDQVAVKLGLSEATVRTHVRNFTDKLGVNSVGGALVRYLNPTLFRTRT